MTQIQKIHLDGEQTTHQDLVTRPPCAHFVSENQRLFSIDSKEGLMSLEPEPRGCCPSMLYFPCSYSEMSGLVTGAVVKVCIFSLKTTLCELSPKGYKDSDLMLMNDNIDSLPKFTGVINQDKDRGLQPPVTTLH